jgi:hypothetical protein
MTPAQEKEIETQAIVTTLEAQRNQALTQVVTLTAKLTVSEIKIKELEAKVNAQQQTQQPTTGKT